jgi:hypothetical protein
MVIQASHQRIVACCPDISTGDALYESAAQPQEALMT